MTFRASTPYLCIAVISAIATSVTSSAKGDRIARSGATIRQSAERGLAFLTTDSAKWKVEKKCASCHQGIMTVWAMVEAKNLGYSVNTDSLAENAKWSKDRLAGIDSPRDLASKFSTINSGALFLAIMALTNPNQDSLSPDEVKRIAGHMMRNQESNGSWLWSQTPAQNRPPPVFESDEVVTLLGCLAVRPYVPADDKAKSEERESLEKASGWLSKITPEDSTQVAALRLLLKAQEGRRAKGIKQDIDLLLKRQQPDGGWAPVKGLPSDAYATGQALYVLNLAGVKSNHKEIQRGVDFLISNQKEDGSWPMTPRAQPGATPFKNPSPIIFFGSAWATMGLMRTAGSVR